jgi:hypothetical protein
MKGMLAVLAIAVGARVLGAQQAPALSPGQLVRLTAPELSGEPATLLAATPDTILVARITSVNVAGSWRLDTTRFAVPRRDITRFEIQRSRTHVLEGTLIGGLGMAAMTFVAVKASESDNCGMFDYFCIEPGHAGQYALSAGAVGLAIGAFAGLLWRSDEWQPLPLHDLSTVKVGLVPQQGGRLGVGLTLSFRVREP